VLVSLEKKGLSIAKSAARLEKIGKTTLQSLPIDETFPGFGFYPKPGKAVGLLHDDLQKSNKLTNVVTIGIMNSAVTIRATDESNFSVHELIKTLNSSLPDAFVEGGGHKNAGSITFVPRKKEDIVSSIKEFIRLRQK